MSWFFGAIWQGTRQGMDLKVCPFCRHKQPVKRQAPPFDVRCASCRRTFRVTGSEGSSKSPS